MALKVYIDPGHATTEGGYDPGAVGPNGESEAHVALEVGKYLKTECLRQGWSTLMSFGINRFRPRSRGVSE